MISSLHQYRYTTPKVTVLNSMRSCHNSENVVSTFLIEGFPKLLLGQIAKHRVLSISAESSRARPTIKVLEQVMEDPYVPRFTMNQKGMTGKQNLTDIELSTCMEMHINTRNLVVDQVQKLISSDVLMSKEDLNRYLEPWMKISFIVTATEWESFFNLRCKNDVQNALRDTALKMRQALKDYKGRKRLDPYVIYMPWMDLSPEMNIARCMGVSYANHGKDYGEDKAKEMVRFGWEEKHLTPFEHICSVKEGVQIGNLKGFGQLRHFNPISKKLGLNLTY